MSERGSVVEDDDDLSDSDCQTSYLNMTRSEAFTSLEHFKSFKSREGSRIILSDDEVNIEEPLFFEFELANQKEMVSLIRQSGRSLQLTLLYAVLDGSHLNLYKDKPIRSPFEDQLENEFTPPPVSQSFANFSQEEKPHLEFNIYRK